MGAVPDSGTVDYLGKVIVPILTFVAGFFVSRFTMTKKERKDVATKQHEISEKLQVELDRRFKAFTSTMKDCIGSSQPINFDSFFKVSVDGTDYFTQLKTIANAILDNNVSPNHKNTFLNSLEDAATRSIPNYYECLQQIAKNKGFEFKESPRSQNYESILKVLKKNISHTKYSEIEKKWGIVSLS